MNRGKERESVIQFTPGNSFSAACSESAVLPEISTSMHSMSTSALNDFNFAVPSSAYVLSRNNTHRYGHLVNPFSTLTQNSTDKKNESYNNCKGIISTTCVTTQNSTRSIEYRNSCNQFKNVVKSGINLDLKTNSQSFKAVSISNSDLKKNLDKIASHKNLVEYSGKASNADHFPQPIIGGDASNNVCKSSNLKLPCISSQDQGHPRCPSTLERVFSDLSAYPMESTHKGTEIRNSGRKVHPVVKKGAKVFAIYFDDCYYPAVVIKVKRQLNLATVSFDDGTGELDVPIDEVVALQLFQKGQRVSVKLSDGCYYDGDIYASDVVDNQHFYCVNFTGKSRIVQRSLICLKKAHIDRLLMHDIEEQKKVVKKGIKRKHQAEVPLLSNSSSKHAEVSNKASLLFKDLFFLITAADPNQPLDEGDKRIDKDRIIKLILSNSGEIITNIHSEEFQKTENVVCISDGPSKSYIFLYCVVVGIPVLHFEWVDVSLQRNVCQSYCLYVVPAGINMDNEIIEQSYSKREPYSCLNPLRIYVHQDAKTDSKDLNLVLSKAGCKRVASGIIVTERTRILNFSRLKIDFILILSEKVPSVIWEASTSNDIPVVSYNWLVECLINNRKVDVTVSPLFLYKPL